MPKRCTILSVLIVLCLGVILFLLPNEPGVNARGNQFKGILPPQKIHKIVVEEPTPPPPEVEIVTPNIRLVINIPAKRVSLLDEEKEVMQFDIAVGQPYYKTPVGPQVIDTIIWNPWWIPPDSPWARGAAKAPPGPKNPLGPVKMLMGQGIRLHGNNKPSSIGQAASHGCLRMHNEEAARLAWYIQKKINNSDDSLFEKYSKYRNTSFYVPLNTPVTVDIVYEPVVVKDDEIYIYHDVYGWGSDLKTEVVNSLIKNGIDLKKVDAYRLSELKYPKGRGDITKIKIKELFSPKTVLNACTDE